MVDWWSLMWVKQCHLYHPFSWDGNHTTYQNADQNGGWCLWQCFPMFYPHCIEPMDPRLWEKPIGGEIISSPAPGSRTRRVRWGERIDERLPEGAARPAWDSWIIITILINMCIYIYVHVSIYLSIYLILFYPILSYLILSYLSIYLSIYIYILCICLIANNLVD